MATIGPLLRRILTRLDASTGAARTYERLAIAARLGSDEVVDQLPVTIDAGGLRPFDGETWPEFRNRAAQRLAPVQDFLRAVCGQETEPIYSADSLSGWARSEQIQAIASYAAIASVELDPPFRATLLDDVANDLALTPFRQQSGDFRGRGVRVAILDSGVDTAHPFLQVAESFSTSGEDVALPGHHGTHCAGSIASRDDAFSGVAPDATLLNIKVLRRDGTGTHTAIARGVDAALDRSAHVLSMSIGFNHRPVWSDRGHGWACPDGNCTLCRAVDNAVSLGVTAVVAAGNEHDQSESLRTFGFGGSFDTELSCPGQSRGAITVGAITKTTFLTAGFSSRGPSAFGTPKPDIAAAGVNILSTVPAPRNPDGTLVPNPARSLLFGRASGTSMATPIVAGAVALIIESRQALGLPVDPRSVREVLLQSASTPTGSPVLEVGAGRLRFPLNL